MISEGKKVVSLVNYFVKIPRTQIPVIFQLHPMAPDMPEQVLHLRITVDPTSQLKSLYV